MATDFTAGEAACAISKWLQESGTRRYVDYIAATQVDPALPTRSAIEAAGHPDQVSLAADPTD